MYEPLVSFLSQHQMKGVLSRFFGGTLWK